MQQRQLAEKEALRLRTEQKQLQAEADAKRQEARELRKQIREQICVDPLMNDEMRALARQACSGSDPKIFWDALEERRKEMDPLAVGPENNREKLRVAMRAANSAQQRLQDNIKAESMAQKTA